MESYLLCAVANPAKRSSTGEHHEDGLLVLASEEFADERNDSQE